MHHRLVSGMTGSGKSFYVWALAGIHPGPVIYWNPLAQKPETGAWIRADCRNSATQIIDAAAFRLRPVCYTPSATERQARRELEILCDELMSRTHNPPLLLIIDEADEHCRDGDLDSPIRRIAKRGRNQGLELVAVTQFPADIAKSVVRNCRYRVLFRVEDAGSYYKAHHMPVDDIDRLLTAGGEHAYVTYIDGDLKGPYRVAGNQVDVPARGGGGNGTKAE